MKIKLLKWEFFLSLLGQIIFINYIEFFRMRILSRLFLYLFMHSFSVWIPGYLFYHLDYNQMLLYYYFLLKFFQLSFESSCFFGIPPLN